MSREAPRGTVWCGLHDIYFQKADGACWYCVEDARREGNSSVAKVQTEALGKGIIAKALAGELGSADLCRFPACTPTPALVLAAFKFDHDRSRANGAFRALAEIGLAVAYGQLYSCAAAQVQFDRNAEGGRLLLGRSWLLDQNMRGCLP